MAIIFYTYPRCGTCRNAKKWFESEGIEIDEVHLIDETPTKEKIKELLDISGLELKKFFNTNGKVYRELGLKDKLPNMSEDEALTLLASDGMLIKRPIATDGKKVTVGFKEDVYAENWK